MKSFLRWSCGDTQLASSKMDAAAAPSSLCDAQPSRTHIQSLPSCDTAVKHAHLQKQYSLCYILPDLSVLNEMLSCELERLIKCFDMSMTVHLLISVVNNLLYNLVGSVTYKRVYMFCMDSAGTTTSARR